MSAQLSFDGVDMLDDEDEDLFDDDFVRQKMKRRSKQQSHEKREDLGRYLWHLQGLPYVSHASRQLPE